MSQGDVFLAYRQYQEYLANQKFEEGESYIQDPPYAEDAYISEDERWEELCRQQG